MFDLSFSEILIVGVAALVVLGPEKLPEVARTAGRLLARAQSYLTQVKGEIERETQLSEIKRIREEISSSAADLKKSFTEIESGVKAETDAIRETVSTVKESVDSVTKSATPDPYTKFNQAEATLPTKSRRTFEPIILSAGIWGATTMALDSRYMFPNATSRQPPWMI